MKHIELTAIRTLTLLGVLACSPLLRAADPLEVRWNQVCRVAGGRTLVVTTADGKTVEGYCMSIDVEEMRVTTADHKVVKIARQTLAKLQVRRSRAHQLALLRKGVHSGLATGFDLLLSPSAPAGLVLIPGTLAWGAVSAPFCVLGDLRAKVTGTQELKPI